MHPQAVAFDTGNALTAWQSGRFCDARFSPDRCHDLFAAGKPICSTAPMAGPTGRSRPDD
ncbi:hypothetical protein I5535_00235 [Rhodobacteraceae bacterium F11138]|nr:hypothetical protein [Rhodobacteraceae bacterium F11138]